MGFGGVTCIELFNKLLVSGYFSDESEDASLTLTVKKAGLDTSETESYQPVSKFYECMCYASYWNAL